MGFFDFSFGDSGGDQANNFVDGSAIVMPDSFGFSIPYVDSNVSLFSPPSLAPDGAMFMDSRANTSFWSFDQSKISAGLSDVIGSVVKAGVGVAVKAAGDSINRNTNQPGAVGSFFQNFQATKTGAQINAASIGNRAMNFLANPLVWFAVVGVVGVYLVTRK